MTPAPGSRPVTSPGDQPGTRPAAAVLPFSRDPADFALTDVGLAERFLDRHGSRLRYCEPLGGWFAWAGHHWALDDRGAAYELAVETVRSLYAQASDTEDRKAREAIAAYALRSEGRRTVEAVVSLAARLGASWGVVVSPRDMDADAWSLSTPSGDVNLRTGELGPSDRGKLSTSITAARFIPGARSELWESIIARALPDLEVRTFVQRAAGSSLVGEQRDERLLFVRGQTGTCKSTFMRAIQAAMGSYASTADFETFLERRPQAGGAREDLARLANKRMVASLEVDEGRRLAVGLIKSLVGGDEIAVRSLYSRTFTYVPRFTLWLVANVRPRVPAEDGAVWRRVLEIPFTVQIPEAERDPAVKETLCDQEKSGPAILAWLVEGCLAWQREGLRVPNAVRSATADYRAEVDTIAGFLAEKTEQQPGLKAPAGELYQVYRAWSEAQGERPLTASMFKGRLGERGLAQVRGKAGLVWLGLAILHDDDGPGVGV